MVRYLYLGPDPRFVMTEMEISPRLPQRSIRDASGHLGLSLPSLGTRETHNCLPVGWVLPPLIPSRPWLQERWALWGQAPAVLQRRLAPNKPMKWRVPILVLSQLAVSSLSLSPCLPFQAWVLDMHPLKLRRMKACGSDKYLNLSLQRPSIREDIKLVFLPTRVGILLCTRMTIITESTKIVPANVCMGYYPSLPNLRVNVFHFAGCPILWVQLPSILQSSVLSALCLCSGPSALWFAIPATVSQIKISLSALS